MRISAKDGVGPIPFIRLLSLHDMAAPAMVQRQPLTGDRIAFEDGIRHRDLNQATLPLNRARPSGWNASIVRLPMSDRSQS